MLYGGLLLFALPLFVWSQLAAMLFYPLLPTRRPLPVGQAGSHEHVQGYIWGAES